MRTAIRIAEQLLKEAKVLAARNGKSLTAFIRRRAAGVLIPATSLRAA
jgi:hypothetical protein